MSFWYGLPYREIRYEMPFSAIQAYARQLPALQAEYRLMLGEASSVPWMKENNRRQWSRELQDRITDGQPVLRRAKVVPRAVLAMKGILVTNAE